MLAGRQWDDCWGVLSVVAVLCQYAAFPRASEDEHASLLNTALGAVGVYMIWRGPV